MYKLQKIEFTAILAFFISSFLSIVELFQKKDNFILELLLVAITIISVFIFLITYIIKIIREKNKYIKLLNIFIPLVGFHYWGLFSDKIMGFRYSILNIIAILLVLTLIILYNIYLVYYYGKNNIMIITIILYNISSIFTSLNETGINGIHNCYYVFLIVYILFGYIEFFIRSKLIKNKT